MKRSSVLAAISVIATMTLSTSAEADLIIDGGFNSGTHTFVGFDEIRLSPYRFEVWGEEASVQVTGTENGVTPFEGDGMLRMEQTVLIGSSIQQRFDVSSFSSQIDTGLVTADFGAVFNVASDLTTSAEGSMSILYISSDVSGNLFANNLGFTNFLTEDQGSIDSDGLTWQYFGISGDLVPIGTRSVLIEANYFNASISGREGYVDDVQFTLNTAAVPEPSSAILLATGVFGLLVLRKRKTPLITDC